MLSIFIVLIAIVVLVIVFAALGLPGWLGLGISSIVDLLASGISGCFGCSIRVILYIILASMLIGFVIQML